jgi:ribonuclease-3
VAVRDPVVAPVHRRQLSLTGTFEEILGHAFTRPELLREALTHRSVINVQPGKGRKAAKSPRPTVSNERLEFLGDRVLGLLIAEWLVERFPDEQEGGLGRRLGHLVSMPVLAEVAGEIGLADALNVAPGETRAGVKGLANVLADALEASLGAMFVDAGLDPARNFIHRAFAEVMETQAAPPKDSKTGLQEWAQRRGLELPRYVVASRAGPSHSPVFVVTVAVAGRTGSGTAGSKRAAEQLAATDLLGQLENT